MPAMYLAGLPIPAPTSGRMRSWPG